MSRIGRSNALLGIANTEAAHPVQRSAGVWIENQAVVTAIPMMLTAAAVVVGAGVILFDPIFQGLAIALMAGEVASLALSRMTVPIVYFIVNRRRKLA